jgi:hypothetical protein
MKGRVSDRRVAWALVAAGPLLVGLAALPGGFASLPRLALAAPLLLIAPGHALFLLLGPSRRFWDRAAEDFAASLALLGAVGLVGRLAGAGTAAALVTAATATTVAAACAATRAPARAGGGAGKRVPADEGHRSAGGPPGSGQPCAAGSVFAIGIALIALAIGVDMARRGGSFGILEDAPDHMATVREIIETGDLLPPSGFYPPLAGDRSIDPRKGFFHLALALLCRASGADPAVVWRWIPALVAPLAVLAFGGFARRLAGGDAAGLLATLLFALFYGGPGKDWLQISPYGTNVAQIVFWTGAAIVLRGMGEGGARVAARLAIVAFAGAAVHLTAVVLLFAFIAAMGLGALLSRGPRAGAVRGAAVMGLAAGIGALPVLVFRVANGYPATNPIHTHLQGVATIGPSLHIVRPDLVLSWFGWTGLLALPLSLGWLRRARRNDAALAMVSAAWFPVLLAWNPVLAPMVDRAIGYLAARLFALVPHAAIVACAVAAAVRAFRPGAGRRTARVGAAALLAVVAIAVRFDASGVSAMRSAEVQARTVPTSVPWEGPLRALDERIHASSVILSDPVTSYCIPAYTRHWIVSALNQHTSPTDALAAERARDLERMLSPVVAWSERLPLFEKHEVSYVLLNGTFSRPIHHFYCSIYPAVLPEIRRSFLEARGPSGAARFEIVSEERGFLLLRVRDLAPAPEDSAARNPFLVEAVAPDARPVGAGMEGAVRLVAARMDETRAVTGGDFTMTCYFERTGGPASLFPYEVFVRCETDYAAGLLGRLGWDKIDRRIAQMKSGRIYRFRSQHAPCEGLHPPQDWRVGGLVADRFQVDVPGGASAGTYRVKVVVRTPPFLENYALSDYVSDRDYYDGVEVGRISVTEP